MSKKHLRILSAVLALSLVAASCGDDADESTEAPVPSATEASEPDSSPDDDDMGESEAPGTVVEVAVASGAFPTLVAAVQAAGLVDVLSGEGPFTVFAPTEEAFAAALDALGLSAEDLLADTELLTAVLTYHVLPVAAPAEVVVTLDGQNVATVGGAEVAITVDGATVMVNDATVVAADIEASNGIIHVIDTVLLPPMPELEAADDMGESEATDDMGESEATDDMGESEATDDMGESEATDDMGESEATDDMGESEATDDMGESEAPGTVVEVAVASGAFPTLVAAVQAAGLVDVLSGEGPFTVFAPTEEAFAAALDALGLSAEDLLADTELLTAVLTYHVLPVAAPAEVVVTLDGQNVATVGGAEVAITVDGATVMVNDATVVAADIEASNGIIHVIDTVLLPPAAQ